MNSIFNILPVGGVKHGYRSDIDGLRAIACLAVVTFHAFPNHLKGGFVGVDIFFVISGFLISSILYRNLFNADAPGRVNIVDFYIRRVRRIFPALLAVLITTLILGWFVLLPEEYELLGKHTLGGATYINNFMLYKESGDYFNTASNAKPLLHLWSLGVEEQFYLIFPIIVWLVYKTNLNFVLCLTVFTVVSFTLNRNGVSHNQQTSAFYLPWCRFWELSIGAILAYTVNYHKGLVEKAKTLITDNIVADTISKFIFRNSNDDLRRNLVNNLISILGLVTIIYGIATINNDITFPGTKALIPVFGALMIIGAGKTAVINKYILSNRVMVFLGLISYPLYLWHWPLLSLAYICEGQMPDAWIRGVAVVIAIVLATFTYFVIEPPLRYGSHSKTKAVGLFITLLVIGGLGLLIYRNKGLPFRYANVLSKEEKYIANTTSGLNKVFSIKDEFVSNCKKIYPNWNENANDDDVQCALQSKEGENNIALVGSSHATHLFYGISQLAKADGNSIALFSKGSQSPFLYLQSKHPERLSWYNSISEAYRYILQHKNLKVIILANLSLMDFIDLNNPDEKDQQKVLVAGLRRSFETLKDRKVIVVLDTPLLPFNPSKCITKRKLSFKKPSDCNYERSITIGKRDLDAKTIRLVAKEYSNVVVVDLESLFCQKDKCHAKVGNDVLYLDEHHLNYKGSKYVAKEIYKFVKEDLL